MLRGAAAVACLVALAGCSLAAGGGPAAHPNVLRYGDQIEPDSLNPYLSNTLAAGRVETALFSGLLRYGPGGHLLPDLAIAVPTRRNGGISPDGKTYTYRLNPRALWHDGVPVTAADVVYTWRAIMNPRNNITSRAGYDEIANVIAPDPHTVRIVYRERYAPAISNFANGSSRQAILPKHVLEGLDFNTADFNHAPIGSGPYRFERWNRGSEIDLVAFPKFFRGPPKIAKIVYRIVPDTNTLFNAVRSHDLDAAEIEAGFVALARGSAGLAVATAPTLAYRHLDFNTTRAGLDERDVRLALSYALDRGAIYKKIYFGFGARNPGDELVAFGWGDPRLAPYPYDPRRAETLLDRAGWRRGPDGMRAKNGRKLAFTIRAIAGQKPAEETEVEAQADWARIGVGLTVQNSPGTTLFAYDGPLARGDYDLAYYAFTRDADPDDTQTLGSSSIPPRGRNWTRWSSATFDALQRRAASTLDPIARHALYARLEDTIVANDPFDTIYWVPSIIAYDRALAGLQPTPGTTIFWNAEALRFNVP